MEAGMQFLELGPGMDFRENNNKLSPKEYEEKIILRVLFLYTFIVPLCVSFSFIAAYISSFCLFTKPVYIFVLLFAVHTGIL